ncbi:MAG: lipopolysaccharide transport periplasmic protein LptA [Burkholderiales bacterium]
MRFVLIGFAPLALLPCLMFGSAHAERSDREKPVNIEADRMSLDDLRKESIFEGNVVLTQGTLTLKADRITVKQDQQGFSSGIALGKPASFRQKREGADEFIEGFGDRVEYDGKGEKVQLFTNARIKRGEDEVKGDYISYNSVTEFYEVIGTKGATAANSGQRVKAVIQPKKKNIDPVSGAPNK